MSRALAFLLTILLFASVGADAQQNQGGGVRQSGNVTPGHGACWTTYGVVQDCGTPSNPFITGGVGVLSSNQTSIGIDNARNTGGYNQLGLGVTGAAGWITLIPFGGAPNIPLNIVVPALNFIVDGTTYPFPGTGSTPGGANTDVQFNNAGSFGGVPGFTFVAPATLSLGLPGTSVGTLAFGNASGGTVDLIPTTGALGSSVISIPAVIATMATQTTAVSGHCPQWNSSLILVDSGGMCGGGGGGMITIGTTPISGGTSGYILFNSGGFVGNMSTTGSPGNVVLSISPSLVTPNLGTPSTVNLSNATNLPIGAIVGLGTGVAGALGSALNGSGGLVGYSGALGTPTSGTLTFATGLPISGITGLGAGVAAALAESVTGSGGIVEASLPTISGLTVTTSFTALGLVTNSDLVNSATTVNGQTCTLGSTCAITASATSITIGTTTTIGGSAGRVLSDDGTHVQEVSYGLTGTNTLVETTGGGLITASVLPLATSSAFGAVKPDGVTIPVTAGVISTAATTINGTVCTPASTCTITTAASSISVGTTTITSGTPGQVFYNNAGVLGGLSTTGSGSVVLATSPALVTPALGTPASGVATNLTGTAAGLTSGATNGLISATTTVVVSAATAPTTGQVLTAGSSVAASWQTPASGAGFANPSATAGPAAVNGTAITVMRSDSAPAVQKASNAQFGISEGDGQSITCVSGVCSSLASDRTAASPTILATDLSGAIYISSGTLTVPSTSVFTAGATVIAVNYSATSTGAVTTTPTVNSGANCVTATGIPAGAAWFMQSNGTSIDCFQVGGVGGATGANPTGTAGPTAVNGSATTFMRSDAAPAIQKATNAQFGIAEGDNQSITCVVGVCSATSSERTAAAPTILASDLFGSIYISSGTLTVPATSTFVAKSTVLAVNYAGSSTGAVTTTPTINAGGGCVTATGIPAAGAWLMQSNGTSVDCLQIISNPNSGPTTLSTGTTVSLSAPREYYVCTGTCTVTPPVPAAGYEFCVLNDDNVSTVVTLAALGGSAQYENQARTAYGTAGTGTAVSGGAVGDKICILGRDSTHYLTPTAAGSWVMN